MYNINKLAINKDKTEMMIVCKNRFRKKTNKITMKASDKTVKQVKKVKILGYTIQSNLKNDTQIGNTISNLNNRLYNIKKLGTKTKTETRAMLVKSLVIGKLNYSLPLLINSTKAQLSKLNTIVNKSCKIIIGNICLKWSSTKLQTRCKLNNIWHMILIQGLTLLHKIKRTNEPESINDMFKYNDRPQGKEHKLCTNYTPKTNCMKKFIIYKLTHIYNYLDTDFHKMTIKKFKNDIKYNVPITFPNTAIPNTSDTESDSNTE